MIPAEESLGGEGGDKQHEGARLLDECLYTLAWLAQPPSGLGLAGEGRMFAHLIMTRANT